jgi:predicted nucleic acid-binding protein
MIILDTNVLSALMLKEPDADVVSWLNAMPPESIWTSSITVFEIRFGLEIMNDGSKKDRLQDAFESVLREEFSGRVLDFDKPAAEAAAVLFAYKRKRGQTIDVRDAMISGIARARHASVATRNVQHFEKTDIIIINPWSN